MSSLFINTQPTAINYQTVYRYLFQNRWIRRTKQDNGELMIVIPATPTALRLRYDIMMIEAEMYALISELGSGTFGTVYLARHVLLSGELGKKVAIKTQGITVLPKEKFQEQVRITRKYGIGTAGQVIGPAFIHRPDPTGSVMMGVAVLPLADYDFGTYLRSASPGNILRRLVEVCLQLQILHKSGKVHMDLKPDNILIVDGSAYLADFGVTMQAKSETGLLRVCPQKCPQVPPERIMSCCKGAVRVDASMDAWGMGYIMKVCMGARPELAPVLNPIVAKLYKPLPRSSVSSALKMLQKALEDSKFV